MALVAVAVRQGINVGGGGGGGGPLTYEQQQQQQEEGGGGGGVATTPREVRRIAFGSCTYVLKCTDGANTQEPLYCPVFGS